MDQLARTRKRLDETKALLEQTEEWLRNHPDDRAIEWNLPSLRQMKEQLETELGQMEARQTSAKSSGKSKRVA